MKKKIISLLLVLSVFAVFLSACDWFQEAEPVVEEEQTAGLTATVQVAPAPKVATLEATVQVAAASN